MNNYITWLYFLVENQNNDNQRVIFLYGLTLPTKAEKNDIAIDSKEIDTKKQLIVFSKIHETSLSVENGDDFYIKKMQNLTQI